MNAKIINEWNIGSSYLLLTIGRDLPNLAEVTAEGIRKCFGTKFAVALMLRASAEGKVFDEAVLDDQWVVQNLAKFMEGHGMLEASDPRKDPMHTAEITYQLRVKGEYVASRMAPVGPELAVEAITAAGLLPADHRDVYKVLGLITEEVLTDERWKKNNHIAVAPARGLTKETLKEVLPDTQRKIGDLEEYPIVHGKSLSSMTVDTDYFLDGWLHLGGSALYIAKGHVVL